MERERRVISAESEVGVDGGGRSHGTRKCPHLRIPSSELDTMLGEKY